MFWGVKMGDKKSKQLTLDEQVTITNLCGMGEVRLNNIVIGTLTSECPQLQVYIRVKGKVHFQCEDHVDICGYIDTDFSSKAQNMESKEEMEQIYKAQLRNICKMLYK